MIATFAPGDSMLPLSSKARALMVTVPTPLTFQDRDQLVVPVARFQVAPPSVDTSTPATMPPPASVAVPLMVMRVPALMLAPGAGEVMIEIGASTSLDGVADTRPASSVSGWTPMSANRLTVACFMRASAAVLPRSWLASRPHDHWTVPAPKTSAPLGWRYSVRLWVAVPAP